MPIYRDGAVVSGTRQNLTNGLRAKPMAAEAVSAVFQQSATFAQEIVNTYQTAIAPGEVGENGTAVATEAPIIAQRPPAVLMYGRVQSGKTAAMILTAALCLDNGFRVVIVLTANNVALVEQTANRFKDLNGPRVFSTVTEDLYEWEGQEDDIAADIPSEGLVLVCAKDAFHLPRVIQFLRQVDASGYPAIVFDDEADAATPDTTLAARSSGRPNAPTIPSTIHRRIIENVAQGQEGESINEILPHSIYIQVTATPYVLILQRQASRIRPTVALLLDPGQGYCGGEVFFAGFNSAAAQPAAPIVLVSEQESLAIPRRRVPSGLAASIEFFLVSAAARATQDRRWPTEGFKHLSHTSPRIDQHTTVANHIERHINQLRRQLRDDMANAAQQQFGNAYAELRRTVPDAPSMDILAPTIYDALRQAEVIRVNSNTDVPRYGPRVNFLIGGNILGRGLTIDDLLVTYYIREAQTPQMDTVWQHARMYGYRLPLMPSTRVYLPRRLATRFKEIHESEEQLREILRRVQAGENVPIRVAASSRPTRPNATEPAVLQVYGAGLDQIFPRFPVLDNEIATTLRQRLLDLRVPINEPERNNRTRRVPLEQFLELIEMVPVREGDPGRWNSGAISAIVELFDEQYGGTAPVYVRGLEGENPPPEGWVRGRLSGPEIDIIRAAANGVPALALMYLGAAEQPTAWYPTLVLPANAATYIVNPS
jgi:Z1 domain